MKILISILLITGGLYAGKIKNDLKDFGSNKKAAPQQENPKYLEKLIKFHDFIKDMNCEDLYKIEIILEEKKEKAETENMRKFYGKAKDLTAERFLEKECKVPEK